VQSEHFRPSRHFPAGTSLHREFVPDHDEFARDADEVAPEVDELAPDEYEASELQPEQRWLPRLWVLLAMALAGVVLAFIWHNIKPNLSFASLSTPTISSAGAPATGQDRTTGQDLEALKKNVTELRDTQQQLLAKIAVLEAAQQHMQQELSAHSTLTWYSNSNILMYRTAAAHPPKPAPPSKLKPTLQSAPHSQDANASQPNRAPLQLGSGRP
jgi:hypothetical protein